MFGTLSQNEHARRSNEITCRAQSEARMTASQPSTGYDHHPAPKMGCLLELPRGQRQPAMVSGLVHAPCTCSQRTSKAASRGRSGQWCKSASVKEGSIGGIIQRSHPRQTELFRSSDSVRTGPAGCDSDKCLLPLAKPEN